MAVLSPYNRRLIVSYVLWAVGFISPVSGIHRFYNGKVGTGIIFWICSVTPLRVFQVVDLFLIPNMVKQHNLKLRDRYTKGLQELDTDPEVMIGSSFSSLETRNDKMLRLLRAATGQGGELSVTQAVLETELPFEEVEDLLQEMVKKGYVGVDNHPSTGVVIYRFEELAAG